MKRLDALEDVADAARAIVDDRSAEAMQALRDALANLDAWDDKAPCACGHPRDAHELGPCAMDGPNGETWCPCDGFVAATVKP